MSALAGLARRTRRLLGRPRRYAVGRVRLELPAEHCLPEYQAAYPLYDRFLPRLAARLAPGDAVVDVGANVGDSLAALLAGQGALNLLAIEADPGFHRLLQANVERIRAIHAAARITVQRALVGTGSTRMKLVGGDGTRHGVPSDAAEALAPQPLMALLDAMPSEFSARLRLVKCDVDGLDHAVIASALPLLAQRRPLLFYECQTADVAGRDAHRATLEQLFAAGYAEAQLFDNFGRPLSRTREPEVVAALLDEVLAGRAAFHYLDLLVYAEADAAVAQQAVAAHVAAVAAVEAVPTQGG